jgi:hypothetical protein
LAGSKRPRLELSCPVQRRIGCPLDVYGLPDSIYNFAAFLWNFFVGLDRISFLAQVLSHYLSK